VSGPAGTVPADVGQQATRLQWANVSIRVEVALLGDPARPVQPIPLPEWRRPWSERPRITLEVADDETVADVLRRASEEFEVASHEHFSTARPTFIAFHEDGAARDVLALARDLTLVDDSGAALWRVDFEFAPYGQVVRSADAGAITGDPRRLYLILQYGAGNGIVPSWPDFIQALEVVWEIIDRAETLYGVAAIAVAARRKIRQRLERGRETLRRRIPLWGQRGADLEAFADSVRGRSWSAEELGRFLDCTPEEAEDVLGVLGFARDEEDGRWYRRADQAAAVIEDVVVEVWRHPMRQAPDVFRIRVEELLRTGEPQPYPSYGEGSEADNDEATYEWDPDREIRVAAAAVLAVITALGIVVALLLETRWFLAVGAGAATVLVGLLVVRSVWFRRAAHWLGRSL